MFHRVPMHSLCEIKNATKLSLRFSQKEYIDNNDLLGEESKTKLPKWPGPYSIFMFFDSIPLCAAATYVHSTNRCWLKPECELFSNAFHTSYREKQGNSMYKMLIHIPRARLHIRFKTCPCIPYGKLKNGGFVHSKKECMDVAKKVNITAP